MAFFFNSEKYVTEDLLINIFQRVDVKSILGCTCVCKTWHDFIINSASLVKDHLTYQKTSPNAKKYVLHTNPKWCKLLADCEPLLDSTKHSKYYYTSELFEKYIDIRSDRYCHMKVHGMCDGLLCFSAFPDKNQIELYEFMDYHIGQDLYLWNPICRKAKKLPDLKISNTFIQRGGVSFGYYGDDYKVIVISSCVGIGHEYIVSVYSLSSNCWNIIHTKCYYEEKYRNFSILLPTKFKDGIAYMITETGMLPSSPPPLIVCFNLSDETFQQLRCPEEFAAYGSLCRIETYGETIAVFGCNHDKADKNRHLAIWTLLRDKVTSKPSWEKKLVIKFQEVGFVTYVPVGFLHNSIYIINRDMWTTTFLLCDLESQEITEYRSGRYTEECCWGAIDYNCGESLLLLNEDSVDPFVHSEMESSCSSILFTLHTEPPDKK